MASFRNAISLRPDFVPPHVNIAFIYDANGENGKAEASFRRAIALDSNDPIVHLNFGMLLGEMDRSQDAEQAFRRCLELDPNSAVAAYNLGAILASDRPFESLRGREKAYQLRPDEGKYGYTYAFFLHRRRETDEAVRVLRDVVRRGVSHGDAYVLLGAIHLGRSEWGEAADVYRSACGNVDLTPGERETVRVMLRRLEQRF